MRPSVSAAAAVSAITSLGLLYLCPYTKVEESFTLHAIRDLVTYGWNAESVGKFDHVAFPGAVPRSFVGPGLVAGLVYPALAGLRTVVPEMEQAKAGVLVQSIIRLGVLLPNLASLWFLAHRARAAFGRRVAATALLFSATQFHVMFYASRTLPNMLAFPFVQVTLGLLLVPQGRRRMHDNGKTKGTFHETLAAFGVLTFASVVLRLELAALTVGLGLWALWAKAVRLSELVAVAVMASGASQALTVGVDSFFWGRTLWPEGESLLFNVVQGQASNWGVSPWHHYLSSALPKLLHLSLPLAAAAALVDRRARSLALPSAFFVACLSCLGHKEWRFVVYVVPALHVCAADGAQALGVLYGKRYRRLAVFGVLVLNVGMGAVGAWAAAANYPGGRAVSTLVGARQCKMPLSIHIDSHSAMTGASRLLHGYEPALSRFPHLPAPHDTLGQATTWTYDKTESLSVARSEYDQFDILLTGHPEEHAETHEIIKVFGEFDGFGVNWGWGEDVGEGWARQWLPFVRRERGGVAVMGRRGKGCSTIRHLRQN